MQIQPNDFLEAFKKEWCSLVERKPQEIVYGDRKGWTSYMLENDGFLSKVMAQLNKNESALEYKREYYTLDVLFVGGEDLFRENKTYPSQLKVLIEHEQGDDIEEEM
jgi:hypothetical protein